MDLKDHVITGSSFDNCNTNDRPFTVFGLDELKEGYYKTRLIVGNDSLEEMIYKGDYNQFVIQTQESVKTITGNNEYLDDLKAAMFLVEYRHTSAAIEKMTSPSDIRTYNRNRVFWGYALHRMIHHDMPQTRVMTYQDVEGFSREFIFHIDDRLRKNIPLVIIVPARMQDSLFLQDWYVRHLDQIEADNALADQYGFALALIYGEGKYYSAEKMNREITAVINRLSADYDIDSRNIFLLGVCEGGRRAFVQLALSPERYAACAALIPVTLSGGTDGVPINLIPAMGKTPIIIKHGANDVHTSVENL